MAQLRHLEAMLQGPAWRLVLVGTGTVAEGERFAAQHATGLNLLLDRDRVAFEAAGMRRSWWSLLAPRLWRNAWRARRAGFRQGPLQGDALQLGGLVVLADDGRLLWREVERVAGDGLDLARAAQVIRDAGRRGA